MGNWVRNWLRWDSGRADISVSSKLATQLARVFYTTLIFFVIQGGMSN